MDRFDALLKRDQTAVERFVRFRISQKSDADDVLQEVFLTAYQKFPQLQNRDAFKAWILSIARNKCNDYFRQKAMQNEIPIDDLTESTLSYGRHGIFVATAVSETLERLGEKDKQILYLHYWKELPQKEIAERLSIPLGTVKSRLYTAKQHFKMNYPRHTTAWKGENDMKKLPETIPHYIIQKSEQPPFAVKWEELWGLFIVPRIGESLTWGIYETDSKKRSEWGEMNVIGKATVHGVEGVEIQEYRHNHWGIGKDDADHFYIAQLTDTHCRMLAENYTKDGVRKYMTFLDGDEFIAEWGYGENNCGKETNLTAKGNIIGSDGCITAENTDQLCDVAGRYIVVINGKKYDTIRVLSLDSYYGNYVCCEQYVDKNGRTVLWRRFNRDDWNLEHYKKKWSEQLPQNETMIVNGETYVHWYDCITDYVL